MKYYLLFTTTAEYFHRDANPEVIILPEVELRDWHKDYINVGLNEWLTNEMDKQGVDTGRIAPWEELEDDYWNYSCDYLNSEYYYIYKFVEITKEEFLSCYVAVNIFNNLVLPKSCR